MVGGGEEDVLGLDGGLAGLLVSEDEVDPLLDTVGGIELGEELLGEGDGAALGPGRQSHALNGGGLGGEDEGGEDEVAIVGEGVWVVGEEEVEVVDVGEHLEEG